MDAKKKKIGEFVWAKMKSFPFWPGRIFYPPTYKNKKFHRNIYFYGTYNFSWVHINNIELHSQTAEEKFLKNRKRFSAPYVRAIAEIVSEKENSLKKIQESVGKAIETDKKRTSFDGQSSSSSRSEKSRNADNFFQWIENWRRKEMTSRIFLDKFYRTTMNENKFSKSDNVETTTKKIGFIGLGNLGRGIVKNLIATDHSLMIWNRTLSKCKTAEKVEIADSPADVIKTCDITFCCMSDAEVSKNLLFETLGIRDGFETFLSHTATLENKGFIELNALDPESSKMMHEAITAKGGKFLSLKNLGDCTQADEGTCFWLAAGDNSLFKDCQSCLCAIGKTALFVGGDAGAAVEFNILHNVILGASYAKLVETIASVEKICDGLCSPSDFLDILSNGECNIEEVIDKGREMLDKNSGEIALPYKINFINQALSLASTEGQLLSVMAAVPESLHSFAQDFLKTNLDKNEDASAIDDGAKN